MTGAHRRPTIRTRTLLWGGAPGIWAAGDAAAVPDLTAAAGADGSLPDSRPTAQHAQRQGAAVGRNIAAALGHGTSRRYRHRDLGLVADLGGLDAVARPLGIRLTGPLAKLVTRGYHLLGCRLRPTGCGLPRTAVPEPSPAGGDAAARPPRGGDARLATAQATAIYGPSSARG